MFCDWLTNIKDEYLIAIKSADPHFFSRPRYRTKSDSPMSLAANVGGDPQTRIYRIILESQITFRPSSICYSGKFPAIQLGMIATDLWFSLSDFCSDTSKLKNSYPRENEELPEWRLLEDTHFITTTWR